MISPLLVLICFTAFAAVILIVIAVPGLVRTRSSHVIRQREERDRKAMEELFIQGLTPRQVTLMSLGGAAVAALLLLLLTKNAVLALGAGVGAWFLPKAVFGYLRRARIAKIEEQLPDALTILSNSAKAGLSLPQALERVAQHSQPPVSQEFSVLVQQIGMGWDLGDAIEAMRTRLGSRNFSLVASALQVNREKGGNLPEALETMSSSLKEIWRLEQRLITASAEGRKAVRLISGMPIFIMVMVSVFQPSIPKTLTSDVIGMIVLMIAILLYGAGLWWLRRVLNTDV